MNKSIAVLVIAGLAASFTGFQNRLAIAKPAGAADKKAAACF